jgi:hypothetical protein
MVLILLWKRPATPEARTPVASFASQVPSGSSLTAVALVPLSQERMADSETRPLEKSV